MAKAKRPRDTNQLAKAIVDLATSGDSKTEAESPKVTAGRIGGRVGGKSRAEKLTKEQRADIARKAAAARWGKQATD